MQYILFTKLVSKSLDVGCKKSFGNFQMIIIDATLLIYMYILVSIRLSVLNEFIKFKATMNMMDDFDPKHFPNLSMLCTWARIGGNEWQKRGGGVER